MTTGSEKSRRVSRLVRPLGWTLLAIVCTAVGACNLNPRPEPPGASDRGNEMMGGSGGKSGATGPETPGSAGGDQGSPHPQDAGVVVVGPGDFTVDGGDAGSSDSGTSDASGGAVDSDAVTVQ